jgi:ATP-dependent RNA helicase DDX5/DBP2
MYGNLWSQAGGIEAALGYPNPAAAALAASGFGGTKRPASALDGFSWPAAQPAHAANFQSFSWPATQVMQGASDNSSWPQAQGSQVASGDSGWANNSWSSPQGNDSWKGDGNSWNSGGGGGWANKGNSWKQEAEEEPDIDVEAKPHGVEFLPPTEPVSESIQSAVKVGRQVMEVTVKGESPGHAAPPITSFSELDGMLPPYVSKAFAQNNWVNPFPIQQHTLPFSLRGYDLIGIAKTGSGKTLAFLIPGIIHCEMQPPMPRGVCMPTVVMLCPVRELAAQICDEANKICWHSGTEKHPNGLGCVALYGGGGKVRAEQLGEIKKGYGHLIVGTPGRMLDFLQSGEKI